MRSEGARASNTSAVKGLHAITDMGSQQLKVVTLQKDSMCEERAAAEADPSIPSCFSQVCQASKSEKQLTSAFMPGVGNLQHL